MKFLRNYPLELIQTLYGQNDKENGVDFYYSDFPGEAKMCLGFMSFRAPVIGPVLHYTIKTYLRIV